MALLIISGPEKAGKSSLVERLRTRWQRGPVTVRHWGRIPDSHNGGPAHLVYLEPLKQDIEASLREPNALFIWDRGWACEAVYSQIMSRPNRELGGDWWLSDFLFTRMVLAAGAVCLTVLGPPADVLRSRRTPDDNKIDPHIERGAYASYAREFGWNVIAQEFFIYPNGLYGDTFDGRGLEVLLMPELERRAFLASTYSVPPPIYGGPLLPKVIICGECAPPDGGWERTGGKHYGPFLSKYTSRFARCIHNPSQVGWTNAITLVDSRMHLRDLDPAGQAHIIAAGDIAHKFARDCGYSRDHILEIPHPGSLYRWGKMRDRIPYVEQEVTDLIATASLGASRLAT